MRYRKCGICRDKLPLTTLFFSKDKSRKYGFSGFEYRCKLCRNEYRRRMKRDKILKVIMQDKYLIRVNSAEVAEIIRLKIMKEFARFWVCVYILNKGFGIEVSANNQASLQKDELIEVKAFIDKICKVKKIQKTIIKNTDPVLS